MTYPTATAADQFKLNFYQAIKDQFAADDDKRDVMVSYGAPGPTLPNDVVSFLGVQSNQSEGPMSSTNRARDETLSVEVVVSIVRPGGPDMEIVAAQRAYQLLRAVETYARVTDTTIGGAVLWCFLVQHQSNGFTDPQIIEQGRVIEITARFNGKARITS